MKVHIELLQCTVPGRLALDLNFKLNSLFRRQVADRADDFIEFRRSWGSLICLPGGKKATSRTSWPLCTSHERDVQARAIEDMIYS